MVSHKDAAGHFTDRILLSLNSDKTNYQIPIACIRKTSTVLTNTAHLPLPDRHIRLSALNIPMIDSYIGMDTTAHLALENSWNDIINLAITAEVLQDRTILAHAITAFERKERLSMGIMTEADYVIAWRYCRTTYGGKRLLATLNDIRERDNGRKAPKPALVLTPNVSKVALEASRAMAQQATRAKTARYRKTTSAVAKAPGVALQGTRIELAVRSRTVAKPEAHVAGLKEDRKTNHNEAETPIIARFWSNLKATVKASHDIALQATVANTKWSCKTVSIEGKMPAIPFHGTNSEVAMNGCRLDKPKAHGVDLKKDHKHDKTEETALTAALYSTMAKVVLEDSCTLAPEVTKAKPQWSRTTSTVKKKAPVVSQVRRDSAVSNPSNVLREKILEAWKKEDGVIRQPSAPPIIDMLKIGAARNFVWPD